MKLNKPLIRKMIKRIETIPESYVQEKFLVTLDSYTAQLYKRPKPVCGTGECLAGEAIICNAPTVEQGIASLRKLVKPRDGLLTHVAVKAAKEMGIKIRGDSLGIFDNDPLYCWPVPFNRQYHNAKTYKGRAGAAVRLLKAILKTDGKILEQ